VPPATALPPWRRLANHQRADLLLRLADELKKDEAELAQRICARLASRLKKRASKPAAV